MAKITKGFIKNWGGDTLLPITRAELVLDSAGKIAFSSSEFEAGHRNADGTVNQFGLISIDDLAKIKSTSGSGLSLQDVYDKLGYVNKGIYVNNTQLSFYDDSGVKTPITVTAVDNSVVVGASNNAVTLDLATIITPTTTSQLIRSLSVDKYGRITAITEGALTNADIPEELSGKTIASSTLDGCLTKEVEIGTNERAIVNKKYVDQKILEVNNIATGALVFGGSLKDSEAASNALAKSEYENHYFKVTGSFSLSTSDLVDSTGYTGTTFTVKSGDTLIVYRESGSSAKFVHVPSGDDITTITVANDSDLDPVFKNKLGDVKFTFSKVFSVSNPNGGNNVTINLPAAAAGVDGYLSKEDYAKFSNYENSLAVSYSGTFTEADGYKLGTITAGSNSYDIYGKHQVSKLELTNGTTNSYNPILKFTETGVDPVSIEVKGVNGILVSKNNNSIEISANNTVSTGSEKYLEIVEGSKFGVKIGKLENGLISNGLVDYEEFATFRSDVIIDGVMSFPIENALTDTSKTYYYGSSELIAAISF